MEYLMIIIVRPIKVIFQKTLVTDPEPMNKSNTTVKAGESETLSMELPELKRTEPFREGRPSRDRRKPAYLKDYFNYQ